MSLRNSHSHPPTFIVVFIPLSTDSMKYDVLMVSAVDGYSVTSRFTHRKILEDGTSFICIDTPRIIMWSINAST